jgi:hypothetical protein
VSASGFEDFLVLLYVDANARARFKANPCTELDRADLTDEERGALLAIDWVGLEMAARSFDRKRESKHRQRRPSLLTRTFCAWFGR